MYEAAKVGLTATGEPDQNELYPNPNTPPDVEKTCVELYEEFLEELLPDLTGFGKPVRSSSSFFVSSPTA